MFGLSVTDFISVLALVVALYGAILSTILFLKERLRLKLDYLGTSFYTYSKKDEVCSDYGFFINRYYTDTFALAIKVRISNNSKSATTINDFTLNNSFHITNSSGIDPIIPISFSTCGEYLAYEDYENVDILKPLITLEPYASLEGFLIFDGLKTLPSNIKITINTVQKSQNFNLKITLCDYTQSVKQ